jgi:uncharacterized protein (TIGR02996 family)
VSPEEAFRADMIEHPDDDAPRLIFADWLEERGGEGDAERAEFIRVQYELAAGPPCGHERPVECQEACRRCRFSCREWDLLFAGPAGCGATAWLTPGPVPGWQACSGVPFPGGRRWHGGWTAGPGGERMGVVAADFRRGFVEVLGLSLYDYLEHAGGLHAWAPLREVALTYGGGWLREPTLAVLVQLPLVGRLHTLDLSRLPVWPSVWAGALRQAYRPWRGLRKLVLPAGWSGLSDAEGLRLRTAEYLGGVKVVLPSAPGSG